MTKTTKAKNTGAAVQTVSPNKPAQVIALLSREDGASIEEISNLANWPPHSTRAFLTGLKKKGYTIVSDKTGGARRYRASSAAS